MDSVNAGLLRTVQARSLAPLRPPLPRSAATLRCTLTSTLDEVKSLTATAPSPQAPVTRTIRETVSFAQQYAVTLSMFPNAATAAMAQALSDISILSGLGQKMALTPDETRAAARASLRDGRDRAESFSDPNIRTAVLSQALSDAERTLALTPDNPVTGLMSHFMRLCNIQSNPVSRAAVLETGATVLSGVITQQPQGIALMGPSESLPGEIVSYAPARKSQFLDLWTHFDNASVRVNRRGEGERVSVQHDLARLAQTGALDKRDANGDDLLSNLHQLTTQPMAPGVDRDVVLAQTIAHLAAPGRTMSQGSKLTCGAATVSYQLARSRPAEYARLVCGLTWTQGQVRLDSSAVARRLPNALTDDGSGRSVVERIVQSSLMEVAASGSDKHYEALADGFFDTRGQMVQTGLYPAELAQLESAVGTGRYTVVETPDQQAVMKALDGKQMAPVALKWDGGDHWVLAQGVSDGRVYFRNPHGHRETDRTTLRESGHQLHKDGVESLPLGEFMQRLCVLLTPSS
ncbi:MAG: hypothetical protein EB084_09850 [Proteobacteria bacterium]|nr:hypothetical protein [Pseudomonadota bacterium]